jgi:uncharacterized protein YjfI (DUF2170 family)
LLERCEKNNQVIVIGVRWDNSTFVYTVSFISNAASFNFYLKMWTLVCNWPISHSLSMTDYYSLIWGWLSSSSSSSSTRQENIECWLSAHVPSVQLKANRIYS